uniref:Putative LAGLIDADG homing endonuclease n=1 Tax=Gloeotilopsis planctonica TaxID=34157 RepID=A0A1B2RZ82_9CHLO|nr:putative LAGLIDADG homing endonuclease [Gloeotilopsis planctonica]
MKKILGSSETLREILLTKSKCHFSFQEFIEKGTPKHKSKPDLKFLEWFIGFFEAEGCFLAWEGRGKKRFGVEINQKDPGLMHKIRTRIGFGNVLSYQKANGETFWRFTIYNKVGLEAFLVLVNGNLITDKKRNLFQAWLRCFNDYFGTSYVFQTQKPCLSLENAWLSGFLEGDGGFYISPLKPLIKPISSRNLLKFYMKFYITQKEERALLENIASLFLIVSPIRTLTNGHSIYLYNCLETTQVTSLVLVLDYLEKHPFLGQRSIQLSRWKRMLPYLQMKYENLTPKAFLKLQRLIQGTKPLGKNKNQPKPKKRF